MLLQLPGASPADAASAFTASIACAQRQQSKAFDEGLALQMDLVVTVCGNADQRCPVLPPGVKRLHWPLEDPAAVTGTDDEILTTFRRVRDQVESRVAELLATIS